MTKRHFATDHALKLFDFGPMDAESMELLGQVREHFEQFASFMVDILPDQPELIEGLHRLMDAKNWFGLTIVAEFQAKKEKSS